MGKRIMQNELNFRNIVRERDNWTCQECGSVEYPQAHHISQVKDHPLFQYLPENGITLCVYCHADAHPEISRNLFVANVIKAEKEGCIAAGALAKELGVHPRTIARRSVKLGILKPMQKWMFTEKEADLIREKSCKENKDKILHDISIVKLENLLTIQEATELFGVTKKTIYDWINSGDLDYIQKGSIRLFSKEALIAASEAKAKRKRGGNPRKGKKV